MNKKGAMFHFVIFGLIGALAFYLLAISGDNSGARQHGVWHITLLNTNHQTQHDLLFEDQNSKLLADTTLNNLFQGKEDLGCGVFEETALWNKGGNYCDPWDEFLQEFDGTFVGTNLIISKEEGKINTRSDFTPTENINLGLFNNHKSSLLPTFTLKHTYNKNTKVSIQKDIENFNEIQNQARKLVNTCRNKKELQQCVIDNKEGKWAIHSCQTEIIEIQGRQVTFCVDKFNFALDFSETKTFAVDSIDVNYNEERQSFEIIFPKIDADSYSVYFSDFLSLDDKFGKPNDVFNNVLTNFFWDAHNIFTFIDDSCQSGSNEIGAYDCGEDILYVLDATTLSTASGKYLFTVTATKNDKESEISTWATTE